MNDEELREKCARALEITFKVLDEIDFTANKEDIQLRKIAFSVILETVLIAII